MSQQLSEELLRQILQYLWEQHLQNEQQYFYWILAAPLIGLLLFLAMWYHHRAHCPDLLSAIAFFFAPRGPEKMLIFKDLMGNHIISYDYRVVKGSDGYVVQLGPYVVKTDVDPDEYAEPVSLLDAKGPKGSPSPFGLWVRQLIASYVILGITAIAFANTAWITLTVYGPALGVGLTTIDVLSIVALTLAFSWFIAALMRALTPQTLLTTLTAYEVSEVGLGATPALDVYSSFPPCKLLKAIKREPRIVVGEGVERALQELEKELGDKSLAASILALLGHVYEAWRKTTGLVLQTMYDISVAARARYHLESVKLPRGFLQRYGGVLALLAIFLCIAILILWLQPSVQPVQSNTTVPYYTPAQPPPPPSMPGTVTTPVHVTPAQPPSPPGG